MATATNNIPIQKSLTRLALATAAVLMVPLIAMQVTSEVNWDITDFVIIGGLVFGIGLLYQLIARKLTSRNQRIAVGLLLVAVLLYLYVELAVGIFFNLGS